MKEAAKKDVADAVKALQKAKAVAAESLGKKLPELELKPVVEASCLNSLACIRTECVCIEV